MIIWTERRWCLTERSEARVAEPTFGETYARWLRQVLIAVFARSRLLGHMGSLRSQVRTFCPYRMATTPALCVSRERRPFGGSEFPRGGITKPRALFFGDGSQRGVTDENVRPFNGLLRLPNAPLASSKDGSLRCGSPRLSIRSPVGRSGSTDSTSPLNQGAVL